MMKRLLLCLPVIGMCCALLAQNTQTDAKATALAFLRSQSNAMGLTTDDIGTLRVTDLYTSSHNHVTHVYFVQQYRGIDVASGTCGLHLQNNKVLHTGDRLIRDLGSKVIPGSAVLTAPDAVRKTLAEFGTVTRGAISIKQQVDANNVIFDRGGFALQDVPVRLVYTKAGDAFLLAWDVVVEPVTSGDLWSVKVDARTGEIISKLRQTIYCAFPDHYLARPHTCTDHDLVDLTPPVMPVAGDGATYNVFIIPDESPKHGNRQMAADPDDVDASPLGWHDTDGVAGAEYTVTRGNNVHAFLDRDQNNAPDSQTDGGVDLVFDFPFSDTLEPTDYMDAATTNLFYMNNIMHDFTWHYGFDEISGNFQQRNGSGTGADGDYVIALAQYGADAADPPLNNATFSTPSDGGSGRMRMYLWEAAGGNQLLRVESPPDAAGKYQTTTTTTDWGGAITAVPLTGEVVIVNDGSGNPTQGCNALINGAEVDGKFAMIDRGNCEFGRKALNAQNAGAIGFIICNFEEGYVNMGAGAVGTQVTIPGVFISNSDCQKIRAFAGTGLTVSFVNEGAGTGPSQRDGSVDNSVIAHEYGHGISNRLTGGPSNASCLFNYDNNGEDDGEQMGEGWSDFFSLVTTVRPGDTKDVARGIATYSNGQEPNGVGLRSYAYAYDMAVNPLTYDDIAFQSVPHGIGTVWCTVLWDLYWVLTETYGYDPDLYRGNGGNNLAIQLVMDGMKMQTCNPGCLDGRDAILAADMALTGGQNQLLLWQVFARRGMGWSAVQGEDRFRHDNSEAFDVSPFAVRELKVVKLVTPWINAGDDVTVELWAVNHKVDAVTGVSISDAMPNGTAYINGSASQAANVAGNVVMFDVGSIPAGDTVKITYRLATDPALYSESLFLDDVEGDFFWNPVIEDGPDLLWSPVNFLVHGGSYAWGVENIDTTSDQSIELIEPISMPANNPALIFYQNYMTERFFDAGIVQVSEDGGLSWSTPGPDKVIRGPYTGKVPFSLFAIPRLKAWHGESEGWVQTVLDLSDYAGKDVLLRFRFASDGNTSGVGWFLDDIELVELFYYNDAACIASAEGDAACAEADERGAIVAAQVTSVSTTDVTKDAFELNVYPNPARNFVTIDMTCEYSQNGEIVMLNNAGQILRSAQVQLPAGYFRYTIDTKDLPEGFYVIRVQGERDQAIRKIVVQ